jgi:hypothetical protein
MQTRKSHRHSRSALVYARATLRVTPDRLAGAEPSSLGETTDSEDPTPEREQTATALQDGARTG